MKGSIFLIPLLAYGLAGCGGAGADSSDPSSGGSVDSSGSSSDGSSSDNGSSTDSGSTTDSGSGDSCSGGSDSGSISITVNAGSGSSGHSGSNPTPSPFQGTFIGTWSLEPNTDSGTADWTVDSTGNVSGSLFDTGTRATYAVTGHLKRNGTTSLKATLGATVTTITGTVTLSSAKHLTGTLSETDSSGSRKASFDLPLKN